METSVYISSGQQVIRAATTFTGFEVDHLVGAGFLLAYLLLGLISILVALCSQCRRLGLFNKSILWTFACRQERFSNVQNVHCTLFPLFLMNVLNIVTAVILTVLFFRNDCSEDGNYTCIYSFRVWYLSKNLLLVLHLQSALVSILYVCHPHWAVKLQGINIVASFMAILVLLLLYFFAPLGAIFVQAVYIFAMILTIVAKSLLSTVHPSAAPWKRLIVLVALLTVSAYFPSFVLQCLIIQPLEGYAHLNDYISIFTYILYVINIQLFLDGLLCLFILRLPDLDKD